MHDENKITGVAFSILMELLNFLRLIFHRKILLIYFHYEFDINLKLL